MTSSISALVLARDSHIKPDSERHCTDRQPDSKQTYLKVEQRQLS